MRSENDVFEMVGMSRSLPFLLTEWYFVRGFLSNFRAVSRFRLFFRSVFSVLSFFRSFLNVYEDWNSETLL